MEIAEEVLPTIMLLSPIRLLFLATASSRRPNCDLSGNARHEGTGGIAMAHRMRYVRHRRAWAWGASWNGAPAHAGKRQPCSYLSVWSCRPMGSPHFYPAWASLEGKQPSPAHWTVPTRRLNAWASTSCSRWPPRWHGPSAKISSEHCSTPDRSRFAASSRFTCLTELWKRRFGYCSL